MISLQHVKKVYTDVTPLETKREDVLRNMQSGRYNFVDTLKEVLCHD